MCEYTWTLTCHVHVQGACGWVVMEVGEGQVGSRLGKVWGKISQNCVKYPSPHHKSPVGNWGGLSCLQPLPSWGGRV